MDGSPRIIVTGAGGFVGRWMTARLRALPCLAPRSWPPGSG